MNVKTRTRPVAAKHTTMKSTYQAKLETLRRKEVRKMKSGHYGKAN